MEKEKNYTVQRVEPTDMDALKELENLQIPAWQITDSREIVPAHVLQIVAETGGQLLAARRKDNGKILGFLTAFLAKNDGTHKHLGIPEGELFLASHMAAVLPERQSSGIGYDLKNAQGLDALHRGIRWVQWTYYPMLTKNGSLNFGKLRARCYKFVPNKYGVETGGLYRDLPTDRLILLWDLKSQPPRGDMELPVAELFPPDTLLLTSRDRDWKPVLNETALEAAAAGNGPEAVSCSVPREFLRLRDDNLGLARAWQENFALVATTLFSSNSNWTITNYRDSEDKEEGQYLFVRE